MNSSNANRPNNLSMGARQNGAALVVGLVLLMVITLLAISSMNTSTLELQMAGNMQYTNRAEQAAAIGLEEAMAQANYDEAQVVINPTPTVGPDQFSATVAKVAVTDAYVPGFSLGTVAAHHYEIDAIGTSARNSRVTMEQGFAIMARKSTN